MGVSYARTNSSRGIKSVSMGKLEVVVFVVVVGVDFWVMVVVSVIISVSGLVQAIEREFWEQAATMSDPKTRIRVRGICIFLVIGTRSFSELLLLIRGAGDVADCFCFTVEGSSSCGCC